MSSLEDFKIPSGALVNRVILVEGILNQVHANHDWQQNEINQENKGDGSGVSPGLIRHEVVANERHEHRRNHVKQRVVDNNQNRKDGVQVVRKFLHVDVPFANLVPVFVDAMLFVIFFNQGEHFLWKLVVAVVSVPL